jgi:hypothetical protein
MALQPIDVQTVLMRLSQVGKEQAVQQNASANTQSAMAEQFVRESEQQQRSVQGAQDLKEGPETVQEDEQQGGSQEEERRRQQEEERSQENVWRDPDLGQNVDISG